MFRKHTIYEMKTYWLNFEKTLKMIIENIKNLVWLRENLLNFEENNNIQYHIWKQQNLFKNSEKKDVFYFDHFSTSVPKLPKIAILRNTTFMDP